MPRYWVVTSPSTCEAAGAVQPADPVRLSRPAGARIRRPAMKRSGRVRRHASTRSGAPLSTPITLSRSMTAKVRLRTSSSVFGDQIGSGQGGRLTARGIAAGTAAAGPRRRSRDRRAHGERRRALRVRRKRMEMHVEDRRPRCCRSRRGRRQTINGQHQPQSANTHHHLHRPSLVAQQKSYLRRG